MTKFETMTEMLKGNKLKHKSFCSDEFIKEVDGVFEFEDGVICEYTEFWRDRKGKSWMTGWEFFKD